MPNWRRHYQAGGSFFFTLVTDRRSPFLCTDNATRILRDALEQTRGRWPFRLDAIVLLPDHLHTVWTVPSEDGDYSRHWAFLKMTFTQRWLTEGGEEQQRSAGRQRDRRRGVWQPKFWEHTLRDEDDYARHIDYLHYNPAKHGLVKCPRDWPHSSFHRYVREGTYPSNWGCPFALGEDDAFKFADISDTVGE